MTKEMKRPTSNITQDSIKPSLSNAVEFYTNKNREAHKCIQERDEYIDYLESELSKARPQQPLPVVPECVGEYIERCKRSDCGLIWAIRPDRDANDNSEKVYDWLFPNGVKLPNGMYPNPYEPDNLVRPDKENQIKFVRAWLDGYTVEKPQLFYLREKNTGYYLRKTGNNEYGITSHYSNDYDEKYMHYKFTKQEIGSMQTGSYEQIEVAE